MAQPPASPTPLERYVIAPLNCLSDWLGKAVAWLTLTMAVLTVALVVVRYLLELNSIALQETVVYMHAAVFLLGAAFTLKRDGHVRVDIFYRQWTPRTRAWIDSIGGIVLLLPFCGFLFFISWDFVVASWANLETSSEPGGLPAVFLLKSLIPLAAATLGLQGVADVLRNTLVLIQGDQSSPC